MHRHSRDERTGTIEIRDLDTARMLVGQNNENIKFIDRALGVKIGVRGNEIDITGSADDVALAAELLSQLEELVAKGYPLSKKDVARALKILARDGSIQLSEIMLGGLRIDGIRKRIRPKSRAQKEYIEAIRNHDLVFAIGPAGTGKTYLAVAMAVSAMIEGEVRRIVFTRPAVEAGERLGFLPGSFEEKVNPYLRPIYDALFDMASPEKVKEWQASGAIEIAPLAYMRGRTLNNCFVILDEAQNTTSEQMKMFLTRIGNDSKAIITGDITQIDLKESERSGLIEAEEVLKGLEGIAFCYFSDVDVVRHWLVQKIVLAYEEYDKKRNMER